jgi:hypothetical protein
VEWASAEARVYTVEAAKELGRFEVIKEGIPATPPLNTFELDRLQFSDHLFFPSAWNRAPFRDAGGETLLIVGVDRGVLTVGC